MAEEITEETQEETQESFGAFFSGLSDEHKANPTLENFKNADFDTVAKTIISQQAMVGRDKVARPNMDDSADVDRFFAELGVPKEAADYKLPEVEGAQELGYNSDRLREVAKEINLTPNQAVKLQELYVNDNKNTLTQIQKAREAEFGKNDQLLRQEMGQKYTENVSAVQGMIKTFARSENSAKEIGELALKNPEVMGVLSDMASRFSENTSINFTPKTFTLSPPEAQQKLNDILSNTDHAYYNDNEDLRNPAIEEVNRLTRIASGKR